MDYQYKVGDRVRMLVDAYDADPDNAYPPGYVARCGEELIVRKIGALTFIYPISVSHEHIIDNSFGVKPEEIELVEP